jgi:hypothetical protein
MGRSLSVFKTKDSQAGCLKIKPCTAY